MLDTEVLHNQPWWAGEHPFCSILRNTVPRKWQQRDPKSLGHPEININTAVFENTNVAYSFTCEPLEKKKKKGKKQALTEYFLTQQLKERSDADALRSR